MSLLHPGLRDPKAGLHVSSLLGKKPRGSWKCHGDQPSLGSWSPGAIPVAPPGCLLSPETPPPFLLVSASCEIPPGISIFPTDVSKFPVLSPWPDFTSDHCFPATPLPPGDSVPALPPECRLLPALLEGPLKRGAPGSSLGEAERLVARVFAEKGGLSASASPSPFQRKPKVAPHLHWLCSEPVAASRAWAGQAAGLFLPLHPCELPRPLEATVHSRPLSRLTPPRLADCHLLFSSAETGQWPFCRLSPSVVTLLAPGGVFCSFSHLRACLRDHLPPAPRSSCPQRMAHRPTAKHANSCSCTPKSGPDLSSSHPWWHRVQRVPHGEARDGKAFASRITDTRSCSTLARRAGASCLCSAQQ